MAFDQDIADIRARIAKAESDRDHWRSSGSKDKYYEAYFLVNALEAQLRRMRRQRLEAAVRSQRYVHQQEVAVASPGPAPSPRPRASPS